MPHKFNAARRHKFEKKRYRVTNWASYSESLRRRGDLTVWFDADALDLLVAPRRLARGGQPKYSDMAIRPFRDEAGACAFPQSPEPEGTSRSIWWWTALG